MKLEEAIQHRIQEIMKSFDFERVHKTMLSLDWHWASSTGLRTPTIDELKNSAKELLSIILQNCDGKSYSVSCGGFTVHFNKYYSKLDGHRFSLDLSFSVETTDYEDAIKYDADINTPKLNHMRYID